MNTLKKWIIAATGEELRSLADMAGTSVKHLHHLAREYREASADLAGRIAESAEAIRRRGKYRKMRLPELSRADLCAACKDCPYFKACGKGRK